MIITPMWKKCSKRMIILNFKLFHFTYVALVLSLIFVIFSPGLGMQGWAGHHLRRIRQRGSVRQVQEAPAAVRVPPGSRGIYQGIRRLFMINIHAHNLVIKSSNLCLSVCLFTCPLLNYNPLDRFATHIDWELGRTTGFLLDWITKFGVCNF